MYTLALVSYVFMRSLTEAGASAALTVPPRVPRNAGLEVDGTSSADLMAK